MSMSTQNHRHQNDVVWFPQAGSVMFSHSVDRDLRDQDARHLQLGHSLGMLVRVIAGAVKRFFRARAVRTHLLGLDDRMLADIGITRADIEAIANGTFRPAEAADVHTLAQPVVETETAPASVEKHAA